MSNPTTPKTKRQVLEDLARAYECYYRNNNRSVYSGEDAERYIQEALAEIAQIEEECEPPTYPEDKLELEERTMDNLQAGDVLFNDKRNWNLIVQGVIGEVVLIVSSNDQVAEIRSVTELNNGGWHLKQEPTEPVELTVSEVAEKLGYDVKIVKEKK